MLRKRWVYLLKDLIEKHAGGVVGGWNNLASSNTWRFFNAFTYLKIYVKQLQWISILLLKQKVDLGTAGVVVINKDQDIIRCMARIARFYKHESCGQCTPCREGCGWMWRMLGENGETVIQPTKK